VAVLYVPSCVHVCSRLTRGTRLGEDRQQKESKYGYLDEPEDAEGLRGVNFTNNGRYHVDMDHLKGAVPL